jgi:tetratricopeptide (TPR) repeat protein
MNTLISLIIFFNIFSFSESELLSPGKNEVILEGQRAVLNGRWGEAYSLYQGLCITDSADPAGCLFRAAVLQAEMIDKEEDLHGSRLSLLCDSTKSLAEKRLKDCSRQDSALCYLYIGHQYANRSIYEARFGSRISMLRFGLKAKGQYQTGLRIDSTLYDLYLGLGVYHYWKSVKSGILKLAGVFKEERERGIAEIELAADSSLFSREASLSALIWIMIDRHDYDSAISLSRSMLERYPDGNSLLWPLAESYYRSERYAKAAEIYEILLKRLKKEPGNYYNIIESSHGLCLSYEKMGDNHKTGELISYLDSIYSEIPKRIKRKQRDKLGYLMRN